MTPAQKAIAIHVQNITKKRFEKYGMAGEGWVTAKSVSRITGLSKNTCQKYLKMLHDIGLVERDLAGIRGTFYYRWIDGGVSKWMK